MVDPTGKFRDNDAQKGVKWMLTSIQRINSEEVTAKLL
jgi:hypothetical protein